MTDHFPLPDDELASAYLDDAVDADERARVENDPDLLARADQLAGIRRAVATTGPVPDRAQRDQHIAKALETLGTVAPISLADRRDRRVRRHVAVLSAAAAIVVVAGVLAVTANRNEHRSLSAGQATATTAAGAATTAAAEAGGSKNDTGAPALAATTAAGGATTTAAAAFSTTAAPAPASPDLGPIDANSAPEVLSDAGNRVGDRAVQPPPACAIPPDTRYVGTASYAGTPVFAFVTEPDAPEQRGVLLATATCAVVADLRLT
jgi:hypothetical protein